MNILQLFSYIENALQPAQGGKFAIKEETDKTTISIFTYDKTEQVFGPVFLFEKILTKKGATKESDEFNYNCSVKSDLSGIKYKLGFNLNNRLFDDILNGLYAMDSHYMEDLQAMINAVPMPDLTDKESEKIPNTAEVLDTPIDPIITENE